MQQVYVSVYGFFYYNAYLCIQRYQEDLEENRASKTRAIQLPLRQLKGVGIGRDLELPLPPKGML